MKKENKRLLKIFLLTGLTVLLGLHIEAFSQGLEGLESGVRQGTSTLQKIGFVFGSFMFVAGAICMKFNSDRGKQIILSTAIGVVLLTIGTSLPESIRSYFN